MTCADGSAPATSAAGVVSSDSGDCVQQDCRELQEGQHEEGAKHDEGQEEKGRQRGGQKESVVVWVENLVKCVE